MKSNETITEERYRTQLMRLSQPLREKQPQYEQRQEKVILKHDKAGPRIAKPVKTYLETLKWGVVRTSPAVFPRYFAVWLLLVPVDGIWSGWSAVLLIWRHRKMAWFVDSLKRWAKVVANNGQYFKWFICNHFFTIKLHFHLKKQQELICAPNSWIRLNKKETFLLYQTKVQSSKFFTETDFFRAELLAPDLILT